MISVYFSAKHLSSGKRELAAGISINVSASNTVRDDRITSQNFLERPNNAALSN